MPRSTTPRSSAERSAAWSEARIRAWLHRHGLRATRWRAEVLRRLATAGAPLSHVEMTAELVGTGVDRTTVYRNLMTLVDAGLVCRIDVGDRTWRFELHAQYRDLDAQPWDGAAADSGASDRLRVASPEEECRGCADRLAQAESNLPPSSTTLKAQATHTFRDPQAAHEAGLRDTIGAVHPHFLCTTCGRVACLEAFGFSPGQIEAASVVGTVSDVVIRGTCQDCT